MCSEEDLTSLGCRRLDFTQCSVRDPYFLLLGTCPGLIKQVNQYLYRFSVRT